MSTQTEQIVTLDPKAIPEEIVLEMQATINDGLAKRGFPSIELEFTEGRKGNNPHFCFESEKFNTFPVIMKSIVIDNFGGSISKQTLKVIRQDEDKNDYIAEVDVLRVWIPVHASYEHFDRGSNGTEVFSYTAEIFVGSGWSGERLVLGNERID